MSPARLKNCVHCTLENPEHWGSQQHLDFLGLALWVLGYNLALEEAGWCAALLTSPAVHWERCRLSGPPLCLESRPLRFQLYSTRPFLANSTLTLPGEGPGLTSVNRKSEGCPPEKLKGASVLSGPRGISRCLLFTAAV